MRSVGRVLGLQPDVEKKVEIVRAKEPTVEVTQRVNSAVNKKKRAMAEEEDPWSATDPWKQKALARARGTPRAESTAGCLVGEESLPGPPVQSINDELEVMKAFNLKFGATQNTPNVAAMVAAINVTSMERQRDPKEDLKLQNPDDFLKEFARIEDEYATTEDRGRLAREALEAKRFCIGHRYTLISSGEETFDGLPLAPV